MSTRLDQARKRRNYREHQRKINNEIQMPGITDSDGWNKAKKVRDNAHTEFVKYCDDVDKDIALFEQALFMAARKVASHELGVREEEVPLASTTRLVDGFFDQAYANAREDLQPKQIAPDLEVDREPAFKDEAGAKQLHIEDAIKQAAAEKEDDDRKKTKLVVAPDMPECAVCGAQVSNFTEALGHKVWSFKCGAIVEKREIDTAEITAYLNGCPLVTPEPIALIGMVSEAEEIQEKLKEVAALDQAIDKLEDDSLSDDDAIEAALEALEDAGIMEEAREMFGSDLEEVAEAFVNAQEAEAETPKLSTDAGSVAQPSETSPANAGSDKKTTRKRNSKKG